MDRVFDGVRAPSTLGVFLRGFTFGHVRQLDAVAALSLTGLAEVVPGIVAGADGVVMLDVDDTVKPVFDASKQGASTAKIRLACTQTYVEDAASRRLLAPLAVMTAAKQVAQRPIMIVIRLARAGLPSL